MVDQQIELQEKLAAAMERLREAMQDVHDIQRSLVKADFQLGRTRYILKKNGYGEVLSKKHGRTVLGRTENSSYAFPETNDWSQFQGGNDLWSGWIELFCEM